jgi:hypothetical protein
MGKLAELGGYAVTKYSSQMTILCLPKALAKIGRKVLMIDLIPSAGEGSTDA